MYAGIKCEFNRASGWAQAEGRPGACSMQEGPGPCGLTTSLERAKMALSKAAAVLWL